MTPSVLFHVPVEVAGPTGATAATRYAGATASGAPASGTFLKGDFVIDQAGKVWVCTVAGTPGTWVDVGGGGGVSYATPAIVLGSAAAAGAASTVIRSDGTIAAFDTTAPTTQAFGDAAAVGTAAFAARRDHKHAMPATPVTGFSKNGSTVLTGAVTLTGGAGISLTQSSQDISIAASGTVGSELDYVERTTNLTVSATTEAGADTVITGSSVAYDGSTRVLIEFFCTFFSATAALVVTLWDGSTDIGRICQTNLQGVPAYGARFLTPSNASHVYTIKAWKTSGTSSLNGGSGAVGNYMPMYLRITRA